MSRPMRPARRALVGPAAAAALVVLSGCQFFGGERRDSVQRGYRGTGMEHTVKHADVKAGFEATSIPAPLPAAGPAPPGPLPWKNVQVLNDVSVAEFNRTMIAMSTWVAGTGNCAYCHNIVNFASDTANNGQPLYTKLTARRMLQMTRHINGQYASHVANTGVTCYTCHRGKPVPNGIWTFTAANQYQRHYLDRDGARVISHEVAPSNGNRSSVKQTEWTYALMINMSQSLGVNCTYCHNTRQFASWTEAPPQRVKAWHGIQMLRDVNTNYVAPLGSILPAVRHGPMGDAPKAQCQTCHQGVYKPLYGAKMARDYPALWGRSQWAGTPFPGTVPANDSAAKVAAAPTAPSGTGGTP